MPSTVKAFLKNVTGDYGVTWCGTSAACSSGLVPNPWKDEVPWGPWSGAGLGCPSSYPSTEQACRVPSV